MDLLAETSREELIIAEIQDNRELDYFYHMLYDMVKVVTECLHESGKYGKIRKIYFGCII